MQSPPLFSSPPEQASPKLKLPSTFGDSLPPNNWDRDDDEEEEGGDDEEEEGDDDDEQEGGDDLQPLLNVLHGGGRGRGALKFRRLLYLCLF